MSIEIWNHDEAEVSLNLPTGVLPYSDKGIQLFKEWCVETNTLYYSYIATETASTYASGGLREALVLANEAGSSMIYLDNMS